MDNQDFIKKLLTYIFCSFRISLNLKLNQIQEPPVPLPWREGIKGRGITPTFILPLQGGGD
jgi:hypothetical protein